MLLKTKFSQLAASEQYTVLWRAVHLKCFDILTGHGKSPFFFPPLNFVSEAIFHFQALLHQDQAAEWKEPWEKCMRNKCGKHRHGPPVGLEVAWTQRSAGSRIHGPHWAAPSRPGRTETAGRRAVQGIPLNHATKKGAMRNKSLCILSHKCGQKNPSDSSLWY